MDPIFHVALRPDWEAAQADGEYRMSTVGRTLEDEGFIHCSTASQVDMIVSRFYAGTPDVVVLTIDPAKIDAEIRFENLEGGREQFPHIYGPLPVDAVTAAVPRP